MTVSMRTAEGFAYVIPMTPAAHKALAWIADRYSSAAVLFDGSRFVANVLVVPEGVAHEYVQALEEEDGSPLVPPCAGGPLADALIELWEAIV